MKKLFTLLCLFLLTANAAWALNTNKNLLQEGTDLSVYDNVIYVAPQTVTASEAETTITLSICMKNTAAIRGFQFDMYLPDGVTAKKNNKGRFQVAFNSDRQPENDEHTLTLGVQNDGAIHFLCGSQYDETFTGNNGELITMQVVVAADMAAGTYPIILKNMKLSEIDITNYYEVSAVETMLTIADNNPEVYTEFVEETGTLTYYYDNKKSLRSGVTELYDPFFYDNGDNRFLVYSEKVLRAVIDPSMKNAPLTSMKAMFYGRGGDYLKPSRYLSNMTAIEGLENLNTSNVTDMSFMFNGCKSLTSLDLSSFNTAKVTDMSGMFADCSSLTSLDLNPLNTSNVTDMSFMFNDCSALTSLDLSPLNTSNVTDMRGMFIFCDDLPSLDLSSFNTDKVTSMRNMFSGCENLKTIICDDDWSTSSVLEDSEDMFDGCTALVGGKGTAYNSNFTDATYARPDGGTESPGYFTKIEPQVYTEFVEATGTLTYYYDDQMASRPGVTEVYDPVGNPGAVRFTGYYKKVTKAVIDPSMKDAPLTSMRNMFYGGFHPETFVMQSLSNMTSIEGLENLNTSTVTDMNNMFGLCQSLTTLDLSSFNTSKVTTFNGMFQGCENLKMADVSSFDINKVRDMGMMFLACTKLTTICCDKDWSNSTAESGYMFSGCKKLVGGNGTAFDSNVIDATYARPDGGTASPGYFTADTMTGISLTEEGRSQMEDGAIYNLAGQRLSKTQRGINIVGGKKIIRN